MNLIAICPACQTSYRVVPDQLRISDGWVRCGECGEVFDASQQLTDAELKPSATEASVPVGGLIQNHSSILDTPALAEQQAQPPDANQQDSPQSTTVSSARQEARTSLSEPEGSWASAALLIKPSSEAESDAGAPAASIQATLAAPVSFMLTSDGPSGARQERRPALWWAMGGLLLLGLLLQVAYRERDQLAASLPAMKPALVSVCEFFDCHVSPLQNIESLTIDSASFQQMDQDSFELRFVVKNKSRFELALPAIELTLTDLAEQPVMRRVFTPVELGAAPATVASEGEWSATADVLVRANGTDARALGYRLLIFYP